MNENLPSADLGLDTAVQGSDSHTPTLPHSHTSSDSAPGLLVDALAALPDRTILDEQRLAAILQVSSRTVRRMVDRLELPPPIDFAGRKVWYSGRILVHLDASLEQTAKSGPETIEKGPVATEKKSRGRPTGAQQVPNGFLLPSDLKVVVQSWPTLSDQEKSEVLAVVKAALDAQRKTQSEGA